MAHDDREKRSQTKAAVYVLVGWGIFFFHGVPLKVVCGTRRVMKVKDAGGDGDLRSARLEECIVPRRNQITGPTISSKTTVSVSVS